MLAKVSLVRGGCIAGGGIIASFGAFGGECGGEGLGTINAGAFDNNAIFCFQVVSSLYGIHLSLIFEKYSYLVALRRLF